MLNDIAKFEPNRTDVTLETLLPERPADASLSEHAAQKPFVAGVRPLFFNVEPRRLFGIYYDPKSHHSAGSPVLICPPIGHEYVRTYNAIRKLCGRLAETGFAVLKFDYCGLGDSYGDGSQVDVAEWRRNIASAASELCRQSGQTEITIVGLRFGATLAAGLRPDGPIVRSLVLWDPIVDGAAYLAELRELHRACLVDTLRYRRAQPHRTSDCELVGFRFPKALQESMARLGLLNKPFPYTNCVLVTSSEMPEYEALSQSLSRNTRGRFTREFVPGPAGWNDHRQVETALVTNRIVAAIIAKIASGFV